MTTPVRNTRQRAAVSQALDARSEFTSAQELHELLRKDGVDIGLTTVYRCLQALAQAGDIDQLINDDGEAVYRRCGSQHHHHLVCRECGTTVEIEGPTVETWAHKVADEHGFTDVRHTVELFGRCPACR